MSQPVPSAALGVDATPVRRTIHREGDRGSDTGSDVPHRTDGGS